VIFFAVTFIACRELEASMLLNGPIECSSNVVTEISADSALSRAVDASLSQSKAPSLGARSYRDGEIVGARLVATVVEAQ
jgi:hypothetical protein